MNQNPLVSIITPCYNSASYIARFMNSLLNQSYKDIEWIVINDGSTDETENIIKSYIEKFEEKGIQVIYRYQTNQGLGGAINTGLKYISGEFFTWCDSDNLFTDDYVSEKVKFFSLHPEAAIVRCDGYIVSDLDIEHPIAKLADNNPEKYNKKLFLNCLTCKNFHFGCTMLRTNAFDTVNPSREIYPSREGQNWQIMLPMFYKYDSFYIDKPMFFFVIREDSISHAASNKGLEAIIEQNNECERTEEIVIKSMHIPEEKEFLDIVHKQYAFIRFWLYDKYDDYDNLQREYLYIKENDWLDESVSDVFKRRKSVIWRFLHKVKNVIK